MPPFCKTKGQKLSKFDPEIPYSRNIKMHTHTHTRTHRVFTEALFCNGGEWKQCNVQNRGCLKFLLFSDYGLFCSCKKEQGNLLGSDKERSLKCLMNREKQVSDQHM